VYLISGEPGVGKSTLLLTMAYQLQQKILYISGEETPAQLKKRMHRTATSCKNLFFSTETDTDRICKHLAREKYNLVFIDSIQTIYTSSLDNIPGSVPQIKSAAAMLINVCKNNSITLILTGHINKTGEIAGPKLLEHLVDGTFLMYSEKSPGSILDLRIIKPLKNRFGSIAGSGLFIMTGSGLKQAGKDIIKKNIEEKLNNPKLPGTVYYPHFIGNRILFNEIEALVVPTDMNYPRRSSEGISLSRLNRMIAVLEKYSGIELKKHDVYINVSGGIKNNDIYMDIALMAAIYSSYQEIKIPVRQLFLGEAGLNGKIKPVQDSSQRLKEIKQFGDFSVCGNIPDNSAAVKITNTAGLIAYLNKI